MMIMVITFDYSNSCNCYWLIGAHRRGVTSEVATTLLKEPVGDQGYFVD